MRRLSLCTGLLASLALLGACQNEPTAEAYADASPPPAMEVTEMAPLAGAPSEAAKASASQTADDAYIASLEARGLMAERRINPDTGRSVLVVFNRPVANPALRGGPNYRYAGANARSRTRGSMSNGVYAQQSSRGAAAATAAAPAVAANTAAAPAPAAEAAAPAAETVATVDNGQGVQAIPAAPAVNVTDPARAGFEMSPMMWGIMGLVVLALLIALFVANRPKPRRHHANLSGHQAPPEASGGDDHGPAHA